MDRNSSPSSSPEKTPQAQKGPDWSILEKLAGKYDSRERVRVDRIKEDIENDWDDSQYEKKQLDIPPSLLRKFGRIALDSFGIKSRRSEERREREATAVALREYREEKDARRRAWEEEDLRRREEETRREAELKAWREQRERESLERDMSTARDFFDMRKTERFQNQRAQEIAERELNPRLLTVDFLEDEVISENPDIVKGAAQYGDREIPVYNLRGIPFSMLTHTVDYRKHNKPGEIGTETYQEVMKNPGIWDERSDIAKRDSGFGTRQDNARGNTISTSYTNSEHNFDSRVSGELIYGFDHIDADSIISVTNGDGGTSNMAGGSDTSIRNPDVLKDLEGANGTSIYNEVLIRRYSENGIPKRPDYIVTEDGRISEAALRHAAYFGVPIVNIESSIYREQLKKRGEALLDSISEQDSYDELDKKISELSSMSEFKHYYHDSEGIGRSYDIPQRLRPNAVERRCLEVEKMEQRKRIDFIEDTLKKRIAEIKTATERGETAPSGFPGFDFFNISVIDIQNGLRRNLSGDQPDSHFRTPGNWNWVNVEFRLADSSRSVETNIYDGEHMFESEKALASGTRSEKDLEGSDSSFYERIAPLAEEYFAAFRENQEKTWDR